jgi:membrane protein YqaA with SNARE-associated domain
VAPRLMTDDLLATFGIYGGSFAVAFIAGLFPLASIELFLIGLSALVGPTFPVLTLCCLLAAVGHQIAKTITYYAGVGALEHGRLKKKLDTIRPRIERWNKAPHLMLMLGGAFGIPPLYVLGFIAEPLMRIKFWSFTAIVFVTRFVRFVVLAVIPLLV